MANIPWKKMDEPEPQSLDERLDYILKSNAAIQRHFDEHSEKDYDELVPAIKQAFIDEGWKSHKEWEDLYPNKPLMSGPEWLARFEKELKEDNGDDLITPIDTDYIDVARRAAGVDDE